MEMFSFQLDPTKTYCEALSDVLFKSGLAITLLSCVAVALNLGILVVYWRARRLLTPQYLAIINVVVSSTSYTYKSYIFLV